MIILIKYLLLLKDVINLNLKAILEGMLFVTGDIGLTLNQVSSILELNIKQAEEIIKELQAEYEQSNRGIRIDFLGDSYKLVTKKEYKEYLQKLVENEMNESLSDAALETLAIIAYNNPVTRIKVEEIRGVSSSHVIRNLLLRNMVKELGRSNQPGRPILYGITGEFLDYFGLSSVNELPKIEEEVIKEEVDLYNSKYKEENMAEKF